MLVTIIILLGLVSILCAFNDAAFEFLTRLGGRRFEGGYRTFQKVITGIGGVVMIIIAIVLLATQ